MNDSKRPKRGDRANEDWPRGCAQIGPKGFICTNHVGGVHIASGIREVREVWAR